MVLFLNLFPISNKVKHFLEPTVVGQDFKNIGHFLFYRHVLKESAAIDTLKLKTPLLFIIPGPICLLIMVFYFNFINTTKELGLNS